MCEFQCKAKVEHVFIFFFFLFFHLDNFNVNSAVGVCVRHQVLVTKSERVKVLTGKYSCLLLLVAEGLSVY